MADCGLNPVCIGVGAVTNTIGSAVSSVAGDAIDAFASAVSDAVGKAVSTVATLWVKVPTPDLTQGGGGGPSGPVAFIQGSLWWYMAFFAVLAVIVGGAKMAFDAKRGGQAARELLKNLLTLVVIASAGVTAIGLATAAADEFANWIISQSTNGTDFGSNITKLIGLSSLTTAGIGAVLVILLGIFAIFVSLIQVMLMVVRGGMLVILAGILPLAAAASSMEFGRSWLKKSVAWTIAFILYKPAAAVVYATAFQLAGANANGTNGLFTVITGLVLMFIALLAMPALMRFTVPAVSALAAGGGAGLIAGAAAAGAAAMPTGAMFARSGASAGAGGSAGANGGGGPSGATGATGGRPPAGAAGGGGSNGGGGAAGGGAAAAAGGAAAAAGAVGVAAAAGAKATGNAANKAVDPGSANGGGPSGGS